MSFSYSNFLFFFFVKHHVKWQVKLQIFENGMSNASNE